MPEIASNSSEARRVLQTTFSAHADNPALVDVRSGSTLTYRELEDHSSRTAALLVRAFGLHAGDEVVLVIDNRVEAILLYLACLQAGITSIPVNPDLKPNELAQILSMRRAKLLVTFADLKHRINGADTPAQFIVGPGDLPWSEPRLSCESFPHVTNDLLAHVVHSSGTTGLPKAIPLRAGKLFRHVRMFSDFHGISSDATFYSGLPLAYLGGWYNVTLVPLLSGAKIVLDRAFGPSTMYGFWERARTHGVTHLWVTPSILSVLLAIGTDDDRDTEYARTGIRWAMVGMAALQEPLKLQFEETFGIPLVQSYGLSESFLFTSGHRSHQTPHGSVGRVLPGYEVKLVTADGKLAEQGESGEIWVRSPYLVEGYFEQPELSQSTFVDGYMRTGDLGRFDEHVNLFITGRIKEIIIKGGLNLSPHEIEEGIASLEGVSEVCVVGLPHPVLGEQVCAAIVRSTAGQDLTARAVKEHCRGCMMPLKVPDKIVFVESIPKNSSGKPSRRDLKSLVDTVIE